MNEIENKVKNAIPKLSHAESIAGNFLLENIREFHNFTSDDLAIKSRASKATWTRFSKSLGFSGLKELRKSVVLSVQSLQIHQEMLRENWIGIIESDIETLTKSIVENEITAINNTVKMLDVQALTISGKLIAKAKCIRIFGMGASGSVAKDLTQKLTRIGKYAIYFADFHESLLSASAVSPEDVSVFISYSGKTKEIIELMEIIKTSNIPIILIAQYGFNKTAELADYILPVSATESEKRIGAMSSRIAQLLVVDILYNIILKFDVNNNEIRLLKSYRNACKYKDIK